MLGQVYWESKATSFLHYQRYRHPSNGTHEHIGLYIGGQLEREFMEAVDDNSRTQVKSLFVKLRQMKGKNEKQYIRASARARGGVCIGTLQMKADEQSITFIQKADRGCFGRKVVHAWRLGELVAAKAWAPREGVYIAQAKRYSLKQILRLSIQSYHIGCYLTD